MPHYHANQWWPIVKIEVYLWITIIDSRHKSNNNKLNLLHLIRPDKLYMKREIIVELI